MIKLGTATSQNSFLGYHGAFAGNTARASPPTSATPSSPIPARRIHRPLAGLLADAMDELTSVSSHEIAEAVTDPDVNYKQLGWYDDQEDGEIGDLTSQNTRLNGYWCKTSWAKTIRSSRPTTTGAGGSGGAGGGTAQRWPRPQRGCRSA